jgi:hypothetical protein
MLSILDELQLEVEERPNGRTWSWLKVWQWSRNTEAAKLVSSDDGSEFEEGKTEMATAG